MRTYYEGDRGRGGGQRGGRSGGYSRNFNPKFQNKDSGGGGYRNNRRFQPRGEEQEATLGSSSQFTKKIIRIPQEEALATNAVTLDSLLEEGIIDTMLHKSISRMNFPGLTPVQQRTIKPILTTSTSDDVIARAKTGTGKTFAFLIPMFQHLINTKLDSQNMVKCVIVAPTRDLALQIEAEVKKIHDNNYGLKKFGCVSLVGGTNFGMAMRKMDQLRPNIIIGTPGRLIDVMDKYSDKFFKYVDFKILDEADRLLEIGFKEDLEYISSTLNRINAVGKDHIRTLLFSATLDEKVQVLANNIMNKEQCLFLDTVDKNEPEAHEKIDQAVVLTDHFAHNIYAAIEHLRLKIKEDPEYKTIVFTPTVKFTKFFSQLLKKEFGSQLPIYEFHGQIEQRRRTRIVGDFKRVKAGLLVCTDVGARGMDFPNVKEVIQVGVPSELANYIHRIGRTARSGKEGSSTLFICKYELPFIERLKFEKKIVIENKTNYTPPEDLKTEFADLIKDYYDFGDVLISIISSYRACIREYGFRDREILPDIAASYGILLNDPERKIPIQSRGFLEKIGFARNPLARKMFQVEGESYDSSAADEGDEEYSGRGGYRRNNYNNRSSSRGHSNTRFDRGGSRNNFDRPQRYGNKSYGGGSSEGHNPRFDDN